MNIGFHLVSLFAGYVLGALPFGYWVAKAHGVDILKEGSGNPGATNVKRVIGKKAGNIVFLLDFLKGLIAAGWPILLATRLGVPVAGMAILGLVGAIIGHSFSVFLRFRGGKGVATMIGGLVALQWQVALIALLVWLIVFYATRYVSLASILLAVSLPITSILLRDPTVLSVFFGVMTLFIVIRHRSNIQRLIAGTENRFSRAGSGDGNTPASTP